MPSIDDNNVVHPLCDDFKQLVFDVPEKKGTFPFSYQLVEIRNNENRDKLLKSLNNPYSLVNKNFPPDSNMWSIEGIAGRVVLHTICRCSDEKIRRLEVIINNVGKKGFYRWLSGEDGWVLDPDQKSWSPFLDAFNKLQKVFDLMAPKELKREMHPRTKLLWKQEDHLIEAVEDIRRVLETLLWYDKNLQYHTILLDVGSKKSKNSRVQRWDRICGKARYLLRGSQTCPDAPIHWSAHSQRSQYELSFVTGEMIVEIIKGMIPIMKDLFFGIGTSPQLGTEWYSKTKEKYSDSKKWNNTKTPSFLPGFECAENFYDVVLNKEEVTLPVLFS